MNNYQIMWRGPVHKKTGLGIASREYIFALERQGIDVKVDSKIEDKLKIEKRIIKKINTINKKTCGRK